MTAIDGGYLPMIEHAVKTLGFAVVRASVKPASAKKRAAGKTVAPAAKVATKAAKKKSAAVTGRSAPTVKTAPTKRLAAKNPAAASAAKKKPAPAAKKVVVLTAENKRTERLIEGLRKMGNKAPARARAHRQHLKSMLGKDAKDDVVEAAVAAPAKHGVATIDGNAVKYDFRVGIQRLELELEQELRMELAARRRLRRALAARQQRSGQRRVDGPPFAIQGTAGRAVMALVHVGTHRRRQLS